MKNEYFFMVYLEGMQTPAYRHPTLTGAETEAKRLAKAHNKKAFVLCSLKSFELNEFLEKDHRPDPNELPF